MHQNVSIHLYKSNSVKPPKCFLRMILGFLIKNKRQRNMLRQLPHPLTLEVTSRYVGTNSPATSAVHPEQPQQQEMALSEISWYFSWYRTRQDLRRTLTCNGWWRQHSGREQPAVKQKKKQQQEVHLGGHGGRQQVPSYQIDAKRNRRREAAAGGL